MEHSSQNYRFLGTRYNWTYCPTICVSLCANNQKGVLIIMDAIGNLFFILLILVGFFVFSYNRLQKSAQNVKKWQSNILALLQKYADCINKLQEIVGNYAAHEKLVHLTVSSNLTEMVKTTNNAMINIQALAQSYPALQANQNYQSLMWEVSNIQKELQQCRFTYNEAVSAYNGLLTTIPDVLYAKSLNFNEAPYYNPEQETELQTFTTDDGTALKELLHKGASATMDVAQSAKNNLQSVVQRQSAKDTIHQEEATQKASGNERPLGEDSTKK